MRGHKGLLVLLLVTAAALAAGLMLTSRDDSKAASPEPRADVAPAETVRPEETQRVEESPPPVDARTGLAYDEDARRVKLSLSGGSYIAVDADSGRVLIARRDRQKRAIASLTKMMTALLVIEAGDLDRTIAIPYVATQVEPNSAGLVAGQELTRRVLLWSTLLESENDSATALAYDGGDGSLARFFRKMNARARQLGMTDTRYRSASGLQDEGNWSSARDQAILARAALEDRSFATVVSSPRKRLAWPAPTNARELVNHNELLSTYRGAYGVKTGFTHRAGNCLAAAVRRDGHSVIAVVLGSDSVYTDMPRLLDKAFALLRAEDEALPDAA